MSINRAKAKGMCKDIRLVMQVFCFLFFCLINSVKMSICPGQRGQCHRALVGSREELTTDSNQGLHKTFRNAVKLGVLFMVWSCLFLPGR